MNNDDYRRETEIIKAGLLMRVAEVCALLLPRGRKEGGLWVSHNPHGDDLKKKPALKVRIAGGDLGAWSCHRNGEKGDIIRLIEHCNRTDFNGARRWAQDFLGLKAMNRDERAKMAAQAATYAQRASEKAEKDRRRELERAQELWQTHADATRSPWRDHALAYFAARHCPLERVATIARETFRYGRQTEYWTKAKWERQENGRAVKVADGPLYPAVHSAMRNRLGALTACHVTFLDPQHPRKAPEQPAKLMRGPAKGSIIELSYGPEGKPFWLSNDPQPLIIAEGIETALSIAQEVPECRIWAGGSLAGIAAAPVDLECVSHIYFARDNNDGNTQAQQQFEAAHEHLCASNRPVHVLASHVGDDFNDLARGDE